MKFKDLEAAVSSTIRYNTLPMKVRTDYIPVTPTSIFSNITIQFDRKDLQFAQKDGIAKATVNIYARISSMSRRTVNVFEDVVGVEVPAGYAATGHQGLLGLSEDRAAARPAVTG